MTDAKPVEPTPEQTAQAQALALTQSAEKLFYVERKIVQGIRDFAKTHTLSDADIASYLAHINQGAGEPAWLQNEAGGVKHANALQMLELGQLATSREALLEDFRSKVASYSGLNADAAINAMRSQLNNPESEAATTMSSMLNALGNVNGKPAAEELTRIAFNDPNGASAFFSRLDTAEAIQRAAGNLFDAAKENAQEVAQKAKENFAPAVDSASQAAGDAADSAGSWFGNLWNSVKEEFSGTSFGGLAGAGGIGALFYIIANSLAGNSWFGKIIGVMAGLFGAVLGFRTFNNDGSDRPAPQVSALGARDDGRVSPDHSALRQRAPEDLPPDLQEAARIATMQANGLCRNVPADTNRDCLISDAEMNAYFAQRSGARFTR